MFENIENFENFENFENLENFGSRVPGPGSGYRTLGIPIINHTFQQNR